MCNITLLDLAMNKLTSLPRFEDLTSASSDLPPLVEQEQSQSAEDNYEIPEHAQGLVAGGIQAVEEDQELTALGLGKETRRLYRHWSSRMTYECNIH